MYGHMKTNRSCHMYSSTQTPEHDLKGEDTRYRDSPTSQTTEESVKSKILIRRTAISEFCKLFSKIVSEITSVPNVCALSFLQIFY